MGDTVRTRECERKRNKKRGYVNFYFDISTFEKHDTDTSQSSSHPLAP